MLRESRPFGITILSAYYILWGLASAMWSLLTSVFGVVLVYFAPGLLASGIWGLIQGVLSIVLGFSLYSGKDWARALVMALALVGAILSALSLTSGLSIGAVFNIAVNVFVLLYVNSERVKRFFATN
jgi:hypothetical protein